MAEKDNISEIKKLLAAGQLIIGFDRTAKLLRRGKIAKVFFSNNCAPTLKHDLKYYCELGKITCTELDKNSEELGTICKKPFPISVIGVSK